jgi:hypothetical protein
VLFRSQVHIDIGTPQSLLQAQESLSIRMTNKNAVEVNDWEKWFASHPIHERLKHLFNTKTK